MTKLSSLAKTILLNHINIFHDNKNNIKDGRPRSFTYMDRVLFILSTGCQWSKIPLSHGSWKTIYHYFSIWSKNNIFYNDLLRVYLKIKPRSSIKIVDTSFIKNVFGRNCIGSNPFDRGRKATKISAVVDHKGIPLSFTFHKGNRNDSRTLFHTLSKCLFLNKGDSIYPDKIYDSNHCKDVVNRFSLKNCISKKKHITTKENNRIRIVVEHTSGWLDKYRRIILRYDSHIHTFKSFHYLASLHLLGNRILNI
jgi:transposase